MALPLDRIRVLELANFIAGPSACMLLAELGADVIKIEPPGGDALRLMQLRPDFVPVPGGINPAFWQDNRGKRSLTVALDQPGGAALVRRLCRSVDIFVTNLTLPRRRAYGLTAEELCAEQPRLIYAGVTAYGIEGPDAERSGMDNTAFWARSGMMALLGNPEDPPPLLRPGMGDHLTALSLLSGILAALHRRDATGEGGAVETSLLGTGVWALASDMVGTIAAGSGPPKRVHRSPGNVLANAYCCADGRWVMFAMAQADRYWPAFCAVVGREEWRGDPRYATLRARREHGEQLAAEIQALLGSLPRDHWAARFDAAGLVWAPVADAAEVVGDPQLAALHTFVDTPSPDQESVAGVAAPFRLAGSEAAAPRPAPQPGEHTDEVLRELGLGGEEIGELAAQGLFG